MTLIQSLDNVKETFKKMNGHCSAKDLNSHFSGYVAEHVLEFSNLYPTIMPMFEKARKCLE
jgi:hypothetical protein